MATRYDLNFGDGNWIQPAFDYRPYCGEEIRGVDDVELAHAFWIIVLSDFGHLVYNVLDAVEGHETDIVEIENRTARFDRVAYGG